MIKRTGAVIGMGVLGCLSNRRRRVAAAIGLGPLLLVSASFGWPTPAEASTTPPSTDATATGPTQAGDGPTSLPTALGKAVAVNDALSRVVTAGVTQAAAATSDAATAGRIGFFTITPTDEKLTFSIVSQSNAVPADGYTSSVAVYLIPPDGSTYRAASLDDGSFGVSKADGSAWSKVGAATLAVEGQVTTIDVDTGAWTVTGTTIVIIRRDLDASMNGWESATPPILLDALSTTGFGGTIPLTSRGTALATDGLTNTPCAIADMPTIAVDADSHAVTFTFETAPPAGMRGTVGGVSLVDLVNPPYVAGTFDSTTWTGTRAGASIGDFPVSVDGNAFTVETANDAGSVFDENHESLTIGVSDVNGCYSLSPAVPFSLLFAPLGEEPATTAVATTAIATTGGAGATTSTTTPVTSIVQQATASPSSERFENEDGKTLWTAIIVIAILAVVAGIAGGIFITRRDARRRSGAGAVEQSATGPSAGEATERTGGAAPADPPPGEASDPGGEPAR